MMKIRAFTLIELLVVISIIIVLLGLTGAGVFSAINKAKVQKAKTEMLNLLAAVKMYRSDTGLQPGGITEKFLGGNSKDDVYGTTGNPDAVVFGPYYEFKASNAKMSGSYYKPVDPWGNDYVYIMPFASSYPSDAERIVKNGGAVIYSQGPDGTGSGSGSDDIGTWQ